MKASIEAAGGRDLVRELDDERADGAQLGLLDVAGANAELDALLPIAPPPVGKRGPGRPVGARNRRTQALAAYYLQRYGDPLEGLLAMGTGDLTHTVAAVRAAATAAGIASGLDKLTVVEMLQFKRQCLEAALPYLHAKLAPTDDKGDPVVPVIALGTVLPTAPAAVAAAREGAISILDLVATEVVPDQGLSEGDRNRSHDEGSHDAG